jgi:hypothetical protein
MTIQALLRLHDRQWAVIISIFLDFPRGAHDCLATLPAETFYFQIAASIAGFLITEANAKTNSEGCCKENQRFGHG